MLSCELLELSLPSLLIAPAAVVETSCLCLCSFNHQRPHPYLSVVGTSRQRQIEISTATRVPIKTRVRYHQLLASWIQQPSPDTHSLATQCSENKKQLDSTNFTSLVGERIALRCRCVGGWIAWPHYGCSHADVRESERKTQLVDSTCPRQD